MSNSLQWLAVIATLAILAAHELALAVVQKRHPERLARNAHAKLREAWFDAVSAKEGSEILAVQTLRNSLMSATMTASTAVLGLMGTVTLAAPALRDGFGGATADASLFSVRLVLELALMALLFGSLLSSTMAVRFYNHAGFVAAMPVGSEEREHWAAAGKDYVRRAGLLYSRGLRYIILVAPVIAAVLHPAAGPVAALGVVAVLFRFDRPYRPESR